MQNNTEMISSSTGAGPRPLSFPQERLFLLDRIMPGLSAYNVPTLVRVNRRLDAEILRRAFEIVLERHEILRTHLDLFDGTPGQLIAPPGDFELTVLDVCDRAPEPAREEAHARFAELARRPFDLRSDDLLRAALAHLPGEQDLLLVVFHHVGSDHASGPLLFAELDAIYTALLAGREPELPALPLQYADYAEQQRRSLEGGFEAELLEYWTGKLAGAPDRLELPTDHPRPSVQSYRGALREFTLEPAVAQPLRELARREGVSPFMALLAAFSTLLHRYTAAEDIVVGVPVSGRHREELAPLLGYFSNTLALRTDLSGDPTFSELLTRVRETVMEGQIYQELPFEKLVEAINPERAQSHSPLFQVLLGYDVAPPQPPQLAGEVLEQLPVPGWEWARFDLSIVLRDTRDGALHAHLEYATDLFEAATMERLIGHFRTLLVAATEDPGRRLSELPLLSGSERAQLLEWNTTALEYDRRCLHEQFSHQARRTPQAIAVASGEQRITYAELERASNRLARELQRLGLHPGALAGLCVERSVELVVAMLAVLKTGAAYVPIEPTYPPERQEFMLADSGAELLITEERLAGVVPAHGAQLLCVDRDAERIATQSADPLPVAGDPEQRAYVIYTSGSTGKPKGVQIRHRSVASLLAHMRHSPGISPDDVMANVTTPAFDLSVPDWYLPLTSGARLVLVPREATMDGVDLADWLSRTGATIMQATATTWQLLVDAGWKGSSTLRIVCGGEALPKALAVALLERGASLWHMYGPTETTVWSSIRQLHRDEAGVPVGGPIANTSFHVLDAHGQLVPVGVPGELHIAGDGLAVGYLNRPELTAASFVSRPDAGPDRVYRTGDLLRWRGDGTLEFHGRIDGQVKLRGFRIELGEIEAVLDTHPGVRASAVTVREDTPGDQRLVAYVVPAGPEPPEPEQLRHLLKAKLPPFMVPSAFVTLEAFPVTPNGKLDRRGLPAPDGSRALARAYVAPQTPVQETLASIWAQVLGVEEVGIDDDFFELGGHSLLAVRMLARVQDTLGIELYLGRIFEHSTIRGLGDAITAELMGAAEDDELAALLAEVEASEL